MGGGLLACQTNNSAIMVTTEDEFICELCGDSFESESELKEHITAAHEIGDEDA